MAQQKDDSYLKEYQVRWVQIPFTGTRQEVCCAYCPLFETYQRKQCRRTGEYIIDDKLTGRWCPLVKYPGTVGEVPDEFMVDLHTGEVT